ncbi:MAG: tetratricopeptide repeat protein [Deltaproteobacteria bacterium]|nr:tetratricopeptide repeat protein [Deltaproteobacteria bacterium]
MKGILKLKISVTALVLLVMSCGLFVPCSAQENSNQDFLEANKAYEAGDLAKAIQLYEALIARAGFSASLCYNLANSYARNGQTGKAVLEYERALRLAPGDVDIRHNLEMLRKDKGLLPEDVPLVHQAGTLLGLNQWAVLVAILLAALALLHLATWHFTLSTRLSYSLTGACLLLLGISSVGIAIQYQKWQEAVILAKTSLLISPFDGAASTGLIEEGRLVRIIKRHDNYALIKDENGRSGSGDGQGRPNSVGAREGGSGWIPDTSFEPIAMTMAAKNSR